MKKFLRQMLSVLLVVALMVSVCPVRTFAVDGEGEDSSVTVYVSFSQDGWFINGNDKNMTTIGRLPVTVEYFDLGEYGLEKYYRYGADTFENGGAYVDTTVVKQPTMLHLIIRLLEDYYLSDGSKLEIGKEALSILGEATGTYFTSFWGSSLSLLYFVNHEYPQMKAGWGASTDYILLEDGMSVDLATFTKSDFYVDGAFAYFDKDSQTVVPGTRVDFNTFKAAAYPAYDGSIMPVESMPGLSTMVFDSEWKYVADLTENAENAGHYSYTFNEEGTYYVVGLDTNMGTDTANIAPAIETVTVKENNNINKSITAKWGVFRGNRENNGIVGDRLPKSADETTLYWAKQFGTGFGANAAGAPIIVDGNLIFCSAKKLYKIDKASCEVISTGDMVATSNFNIIPPLYADGMIFVGLSNGTVQAFNAETLESLWVYKDALKGQPNSPLEYNNGYVYTGFWNSETKNANFVCLSAKDYNPDQTNEIKPAEWTYTQKGGFYWAGAYACDDFILVGTDDGESGYLSDTSNLLSINPENGELISSISGLNGDIRSAVAYDEVTNRYYFTSKGGSFYSVAVNSDGTFAAAPTVSGYDIKEILLVNGSDNASTPAMSTSTPVIVNGRAYIGVSGTSQFGMYTGHNITVIDLASSSIAYTAPTKGYPQVSGLATNAYTDEDGYAYIYFIDNYTPGQVRVLKDKPGVNGVIGGATESYMLKGVETKISGCAPVIFTPSDSQAQYAIASMICDEEGTMYFKNDSAYLMALGSKIKSLEVTKQPEKTEYKEGEIFNAAGMKVVAHLSNGLDRDITDYVRYSNEALTTDDTDVTIYYDYVLYGDKLDLENGNLTNQKETLPETFVDIVVEGAETNTPAPTATPTVKPTATPTVKPTATPTVKPTATPTVKPTATPTVKPTATPTVKPTATPVPTVPPTATPAPTVEPTGTPAPTVEPTATPVPTVSPTATPAPTVEPTETPTVKPTETVMPVTGGDVNCDGNINASDALTILKIAAKLITASELQLKAGDVNGDSNVDAQDALMVLQYAANIINKF